MAYPYIKWPQRGDPCEWIPGFHTLSFLSLFIFDKNDQYKKRTHYHSALTCRNSKPHCGNFSTGDHTMKSGFKNAIFLVVTVSITLVIAEGLLILKNRNMKNYDIEMWRYAKIIKKKSDNPVLGHEHRHNQKAILQSVEIRTNNLGLRGPDIDIQNRRNRRILFLGSSATFGWGVPESETIPVILQEKLGEDTEVLNAGIGNYNTVRYVELFLKKLYVLHPTDIVVQYFINDAEVLDTGGGNWILRNSQFAVTLWQVFHKFFKKYTMEDVSAYYRSLYQSDAIGFHEMLNALDRLKKYSISNGIQVYFLMTPDLYNLSDYRYGFIHDIMKKEATARGFHYLDILPAFAGVKDSHTLWAMPNDPHPNGSAQRMMADYILAETDLAAWKKPVTTKPLTAKPE